MCWFLEKSFAYQLRKNKMTLHSCPQRLLAISISTILSGISGATYASSITLNGAYNLWDNSPTTATVLSPVVIGQNQSDLQNGGYTSWFDPNGVIQGAADIYIFSSGQTGSPSYFNVSAFGQNTFYGQSHATYSNIITNSSSVVQDFLFNFHVDNSYLGVNSLSGSGLAELLFNISRDGVSLTSSDTLITMNNGISTCSEISMGVLVGYIGCSSLTSNSEAASAQNYTVDLGNLNPGQSLTLNYDIVATVSGAFPGDLNPCNNEFGYGCGDAYARGGDPASVDGQFQIASQPITATIPEPSTITLLIGGLLGFLRLNRKNTPQTAI